MYGIFVLIIILYGLDGETDGSGHRLGQKRMLLDILRERR